MPDRIWRSLIGGAVNFRAVQLRARTELSDQRLKDYVKKFRDGLRFIDVD